MRKSSSHRSGPRYREERRRLAAVARNGLTVQDIRRVASDEMMARGVGLHYPAALIYSNGILSPHSYLGYKKARVYSNWIALEMERLGRMEP